MSSSSTTNSWTFQNDIKSVCAAKQTKANNGNLTHRIVLHEFVFVLWILYRHRFSQVSVDTVISQIYTLACVVTQDEWHDGILHEIVERSSSQLVEQGEVLKVSDGPLLPSVNDVQQVICAYTVWQL